MSAYPQPLMPLPYQFIIVISSLLPGPLPGRPRGVHSRRCTGAMLSTMAKGPTDAGQRSPSGCDAQRLACNRDTDPLAVTCLRDPGVDWPFAWRAALLQFRVFRPA